MGRRPGRKSFEEAMERAVTHTFENLMEPYQVDVLSVKKDVIRLEKFLERLARRLGRGTVALRKKRRWTLSRKGRSAIAAAQKKRWAEYRRKKKSR